MAAPQFAKCLLLISIRFLALCLSPQVSLIFHFFFKFYLCHFDCGVGGRYGLHALSKKREKYTFCIPNLCGLNIAEDAILTGLVTEFLSVESRQHPWEWKCEVLSYPCDAPQPWKPLVLNEVAQSAVFGRSTDSRLPVLAFLCVWLSETWKWHC